RVMAHKHHASHRISMASIRVHSVSIARATGHSTATSDEQYCVTRCWAASRWTYAVGRSHYSITACLYRAHNIGLLLAFGPAAHSVSPALYIVSMQIFAIIGRFLASSSLDRRAPVSVMSAGIVVTLIGLIFTAL